MAKDFLLNIVYLILKPFRDVKNITLEGTVSQISFLGPSFYFIWKNGKLLVHFFS